ncbi:uncharacterized protein DFL_006726 [Arthrobotrys flagrans]|uniref:Uncharacterized protein n=1 Tax=Arthrobotrys flagrans TaxID=97331 RepID=A0A436ZU90_ARTFL|nr:hypothetical protein DFL_006726 [Arthrobotrys flagrans]
MTPTPEKDAQTVTELLANKLPAELVSDILDYAEYFGHEVIGISERRGFVRSRWTSARAESEEGHGCKDIKLHLVAQIPDFMALRKDTAGKGGLGGGRPGRVRKIVFRLRCRDQGWSNHPEIDGTYQWGRSRIDVEVWRKHEGVGLDDDYDGKGGMYRVCASLLQRNKVAVTDVLEYEISWRWDEDKPQDDTANVDEVGRHEKNGQFVRELKGGDEIRIFIKAFYTGWECIIERCEVECWWAV